VGATISDKTDGMRRRPSAGLPVGNVGLWTGRSAMTRATTTHLAHIETAGVRHTRMSHVRSAASRAARATSVAASGTPGRQPLLRTEIT
jgi:hypothetical protein